MDQVQIRKLWDDTVETAFRSKIQEILDILGIKTGIHAESIRDEYEVFTSFEIFDLRATLMESDQTEKCEDGVNRLAVRVMASACTGKTRYWEIFCYEPCNYTEGLWTEDLKEILKRIGDLDAKECAKLMKNFST